VVAHRGEDPFVRTVAPAPVASAPVSDAQVWHRIFVLAMPSCSNRTDATRRWCDRPSAISPTRGRVLSTGPALRQGADAAFGRRDGGDLGVKPIEVLLPGNTNTAASEETTVLKRRERRGSNPDFHRREIEIRY
jgi:hypothetical protein